MEPKIEFGAITDEFTPDLGAAIDRMSAIGMTVAELRVLWDKNIIALSDSEVEQAASLVRAKGLRTISIASPVLKCVLPGAPEVDTRFQQDVFNAVYTMEDQPRLFERAIWVAHKTGARIIRVFSYWRTVDPERCVEAVVEAVARLADRAAKEDLIIGLENEHACNVATSSEILTVLSRVQHPNLKLVWDPANALCAGEARPYPNGYELIPRHRVAHVHAKDCHMEGHKPVWGPLGTRHVEWKGQIGALLRDQYRGAICLETHWPGPGGDKMEASTICGWNLRGLVAS